MGQLPASTSAESQDGGMLKGRMMTSHWLSTTPFRAPCFQARTSAWGMRVWLSSHDDPEERGWIESNRVGEQVQCQICLMQTFCWSCQEHKLNVIIWFGPKLFLATAFVGWQRTYTQLAAVKFYGLAHTCKPWTMPHRIVAALPCRNETQSLTVTASNKDGPRFAIGHRQLGNGDSMHGSRSDNSFRSMTDGVKASSILDDEVSLYTILQCAAHSVWYSAPWKTVLCQSKKHFIRFLCLTMFLLVMVLHDATSLVATGHSPFALLFWGSVVDAAWVVFFCCLVIAHFLVIVVAVSLRYCW
jgi:hypothetical protein